ncbi:hypothetical protein [Sphingobium scionense]|uniref:Uncharacterized protein n=1 Tax=Sphingobium scionense TaxID=1404341 RepID=A0A7W6LL22_9SPHN|nr:hypothetical protein [Sphingobium scionense]MBB4146298.1 hypothetical protein [Sphingobium scionense]
MGNSLSLLDIRAFSNQVETPDDSENAAKQKHRADFEPTQSERNLLYAARVSGRQCEGIMPMRRHMSIWRGILGAIDIQMMT